MHSIKHLSNKKIKQELLDNFLNFINDELKIDTPYSVYFVEDKANASEALGKTAMYNPSTKSVYVYVTNRHPKDIMRSIAHELVHHKQHCNGDLENMSLEKAEVEANAGGYYLRKFEDRFKDNELLEANSLSRAFKRRLKAESLPAYIVGTEPGRAGTRSYVQVSVIPGKKDKCLSSEEKAAAGFCFPKKLRPELKVFGSNPEDWTLDDIIAARSNIFNDDIKNGTFTIRKDAAAKGKASIMHTAAPEEVRELITSPTLIYDIIYKLQAFRKATRPASRYIDKFTKTLKTVKDNPAFKQVIDYYKADFDPNFKPPKTMMQKVKTLFADIETASKYTMGSIGGAIGGLFKEQDDSASGPQGTPKKKSDRFMIYSPVQRNMARDITRKSIEKAVYDGKLPKNLINELVRTYALRTGEDLDDLKTRAREIYGVVPLTQKSMNATFEADQVGRAVFTMLMILSVLPIPYIWALDALAASYFISDYYDRKDASLLGLISSRQGEQALLHLLVLGMQGKGAYDLSKGLQRDARRGFVRGGLDALSAAAKAPRQFELYQRTLTELRKGLGKANLQARSIGNQLVRSGELGSKGENMLKALGEIAPEGKLVTDINKREAAAKRMSDMLEEVDAIGRRQMSSADLFANLEKRTVGATRDTADAVRKGLVKRGEGRADIFDSLERELAENPEFTEFVRSNIKTIEDASGITFVGDAEAAVLQGRNWLAGQVIDDAFKNPGIRERVLNDLLGGARLKGVSSLRKEAAIETLAKAAKNSPEAAAAFEKFVVNGQGTAREAMKTMLEKSGYGTIDDAGRLSLSEKGKSVLQGGFDTRFVNTNKEQFKKSAKELIDLYKPKLIKQYGAGYRALEKGIKKSEAALPSLLSPLRVRVPGLNYTIGLFDRLWLNFGFKNPAANKLIDLTIRLSGKSGMAARFLAKFYVFKFWMPFLAWMRFYNPYCGITFADYFKTIHTNIIDYANPFTILKVVQEPTNKLVAEYIPSKFDNSSGLFNTACKNMIDKVKNQKIDTSELSKAMQKIAVEIEAGANEAIRNGEKAIKPKLEEYVKDAQKTAKIAEKLAKGQTLTPEEDAYYKQFKKDVKTSFNKLKNAGKKGVNAAKKAQENIEDQFKPAEPVSARKEEPEDPRFQFGSQKENLSLKDYRKKVLEERLVKLTIGFSK